MYKDAYIGIFENGKEIMQLTNKVTASEILMSALTIMYSKALENKLPENHYVAWDYNNRK